MKHAFLIIAHNEFEILSVLISMLDDENNDLFIHIDKKVREMPQLSSTKSRLVFTEERIDVRWGASSQIAVELLLMQTALRTDRYDYFHILSGTHLPIKKMSEIHAYFDSIKGHEVLHLWENDPRDIGNKLQRYNFFVKGFSSPNNSIKKASLFGWRVIQRIQILFSVKRFPNEIFIKSDNWLSLTYNAANYLVKIKDYIMEKYQFSYCGDEYFVATELGKYPDQFSILNSDKMLQVEFERYNPRVYTAADFELLKSSECLFARKFSNRHMDIVKMIHDYVSEE